MVGFVSLPVTLHDVFFCVGLGFFTALVYMALRFALGSTRRACFVCDVAAFVLGSVLYFAVSCQVLAVGVCRWYTALGTLAGHVLCCRLFMPYVLHFRKCCKRQLRAAKHIFADRRRKFLCRRTQMRTKKRGKRLQSNTKVLYNSNNLYGDEPFSANAGENHAKQEA